MIIGFIPLRSEFHVSNQRHFFTRNFWAETSTLYFHTHMRIRRRTHFHRYLNLMSLPTTSHTQILSIPSDFTHADFTQTSSRLHPDFTQNSPRIHPDFTHCQTSSPRPHPDFTQTDFTQTSHPSPHPTTTPANPKIPLPQSQPPSSVCITILVRVECVRTDPIPPVR